MNRVKLTIKTTDSFSKLEKNEYLFLENNDIPFGIMFRCPDCNILLWITLRWNINFETLTATPSILHSKENGGCGWHGYLTNGELIPS